MSDGAPAPKPRRKRVVIIGLLALLAVGATGGGAYYIVQRPASAPAAPEPGIIALDPFVVNLADAGGHRFLRLTLRLVVASEDQAAELAENEVRKARARSTIIELLSEQHADRLVVPEGKAELKKSISEHVTHALEHVQITDVLFTEFVVQF